MSTTTKNYNLIKPSLTDVADITAMNENWDKLDSKLFESTKSVVTYYNSAAGTDLADTVTNSTFLVAVSSTNNATLFNALGDKDDFAYIQQYFFGEISENAQRLQVAQGRLTGNMSVRCRLDTGKWTDWCANYSNNNKPYLSTLNGILSVEKGGTDADNWHQALTNLRAMERQAMYYTTNDQPDINSLTDSLMLIPYGYTKDCPVGGGFVYIMQIFYGDITASSNRTQIAFPYLSEGTIGKGMATRSYYNGTWSAWDKLASTSDYHILTYTSLAEIGLTVGSETIESIATAMKLKSKLVCSTGANNANIYPGIYGMLTVSCVDSSRIRFQWTNKDVAVDYIGVYSASNSTKWTGWKKVYSEASPLTEEDVPVIPMEKGGTGTTGWHQALTNLRAMERQAVYYSATLTPDIDTLTDSLMLIPNEYSKNCPVGGGFVYIMQLFYGDITVNNNRTQVAFPYSNDGYMGEGIAVRAHQNGTWSKWQKIGGISTVTTSGSANTYTANVMGVTELTDGLKVTIIPNVDATSVYCTLNVNGLGAKSIFRRRLDNSGLAYQGSIAWLKKGVPITLTYSTQLGFWLADLSDAGSHDHGANTISGGTFGGQVIANGAYELPGTSLLRNSKLVSSETNPTVNGEICWTYK